MKRLYIYSLLIWAILAFTFSALQAQLPNGSTAPDFTTTDINGNSHHLYSYLDQGYAVILKFTATWCPPCWNYHNTGALETVWDLYGPDGTDEAIVLFLESDPSTPVSCLFGNCPNTMGNWVDGTNFPIINDHLPAGPYQISFYPTIMGVCPDGKTTLIGQQQAPGINNFIQNCKIVQYNQDVTHISCHGNNDGAISLTTLNGVGPFTFDWSHGASGSSVSGLSAGVYQCTITDNFGNQTTSQAFEILEPAPVETAVANLVPDHCFGGNGSIQASTSGGTGAFTYTWSNGASGSQLEGLAEGVYAYTVSDENGCTTFMSNITVERAPDPEVAVAGGGIIDCNISSVLLDGSQSSTGGNFSLTWSTDDGQIEGDVNQSTVSATAAGTYTLTVMDTEFGCSVSDFLLVFDESQEPFVSIDDIAFVPCNALGVVLNAIGDEGPEFELDWTTYNGEILENPDSFNPTVGLGHYLLTITNTTTGCSASAGVLVIPAQEPESNPLVSQVSCFGAGNGSIFLNSIVYNNPAQIQWSHGASGQNLTQLQPGTYSVTITDALNCTLEQTFNITEPDNIVVSSVVSHASGEGQSDGSIQLQVSGGLAPFTVNWSNGANGTQLSGLAPGSYGYTVTDGAECQKTGTITVLAEGCSIQVEVEFISPATCFGEASGAVSLISSNASGNLNAIWFDDFTGLERDDLPAGNYLVTLVDGDGCPGSIEFAITEPSAIEAEVLQLVSADCESETFGSIELGISGGAGGSYETNWSNGQSGLSIDNLLPGIYQVSVTDDDGCTAVFSFNIPTESTGNPVAQVIDSLILQLNEEGSIELDADMLNNNSFHTCGLYSTEDLEISLSQLSFNCDQIGWQEVVFTVTDPAGQSSSVSVSIFISDDTSPMIVCPQNLDVRNCNGIVDYGIIQAADNCEVVTLERIEGPESGSIFPLGVSEVMWRAVDQSGNEAICRFEVSLDTDSIFVQQAEGDDLLCFEDRSGRISLSEITGGIQPYDIQWSTGATGAIIENLSAGVYFATINDQSGCEQLLEIALSQPDPIQASIEDLINDTGSQNGSVTINIQGGTAPYVITVSNQSISLESEQSVVQNIPAGTYQLSILDANNCLWVRNEPLVIELQSSVIDNEKNGSLQLFPNPVSNELLLNFVHQNVGSIQLSVWSMDGKILLARDIDFANELRTAIDVSSLQNGIYLLQVLHDQGHRTERFIIQR